MTVNELIVQVAMNCTRDELFDLMASDSKGFMNKLSELTSKYHLANN